MLRTSCSINHLTIFLVMFIIGCGGKQTAQTTLETRPLEENKALELIGGILNERGYSTAFGKTVELSNGVQFPCDYQVEGHTIAIEYLSEKDASEIRSIPPAATGSRLHVVPAKSVDIPNATQTAVYVYFIHSKKYVYHYNPTSDHRADITYREVENRLIRDVKDFLSWYESTLEVQN